MADITKCVGKDCPLKDTCYRHTAPESCYQSYFTGTLGEMVEGEFKCEHYLKTKKQNKMKKLILIAGVSLVMMSCSKESCNCGVIQSDNVSDYSIVIRNSCSDNNKTFYLSPGDWTNAHPGDDYCINNVESW